MKAQFLTRSCLLAAVLATLAGCGSRPQAMLPAGDVLAVVGDQAITLAAFGQEEARRHASSKNEREAADLLEELITTEAAYAKAVATGFLQRPDIQSAVRRMVAERFREEQFGPGTRLRISDSEVEAYFRSHPSKYSIPAKRSGAIIFLSTPSKATAEKRAAREAEARAILEEAKQRSDDPNGFGGVVERHSEDQATRYRGGQIGWVTSEPKDSGQGRAVLEALFSIERTGQIAPLVVTPEGFYIVKLLADQPGRTRPLGEVADGVRYSLARQRREQWEEDWRKSMREGIRIQVNQERIRSLIPPSPPEEARPPGLPGTASVQRKQP